MPSANLVSPKRPWSVPKLYYYYEQTIPAFPCHTGLYESWDNNLGQRNGRARGPDPVHAFFIRLPLPLLPPPLYPTRKLLVKLLRPCPSLACTDSSHFVAYLSRNDWLCCFLPALLSWHLTSGACMCQDLVIGQGPPVALFLLYLLDGVLHPMRCDAKACASFITSKQQDLVTLVR